MKKEVKIRVIKKLILVIMYIVLTFLFFDYMLFKEFKFDVAFKNLFNDKYSYNTVELDEDYIYNNKMIRTNYTKNTDIKTYTYLLDLTEVPSNMFSISFELDVEKKNSDSLMINVFTDEGVFIYKQDNFYINDKFNKTMLILHDNVYRISIMSELDLDNEDKLFNHEIISLNNIKINSIDDISQIRKSMMLNFLESILFSVIIGIIYFIVFKTKIDKKLFKKDIKIEKIFLVVSIIAGIVFSVLVPLYQIPDELSHINLIYEEFNLDVNFEEASQGFGDTDRIILNSFEKVNFSEYFDFSKRLVFEEKLNIPSIYFIRHFPQSFGLIICSLLNLPVLISVTICEVLAVLFYTLVCYKALKLIPFKKDLMMVLMLLPMCVQQMGSFSYDVVLLPMCFLYISYFLYLKFVKEKIKLFDFLNLLIMLLIIVLIKMPYILLGGLIILLPFSKISLNIGKFKIDDNLIKKNKNKIFIVCGLMLILFIMLMVIFLSSFSYGRILLAVVKANIYTCKLLFNTVLGNGKSYLIQMVGSFGWMETNVSVIFTIFVFFSLFFVSFFRTKSKMENIYKFKRWEVVYLIILGVVFCALIILSMFQWTLFISDIINCDSLSIDEYFYFIKNKVKFIVGVQGRYFIPVIPLFLLPLHSKYIDGVVDRVNKKFYLVLYYIIVFIYMFIIILNRYWIG